MDSYLKHHGIKGMKWGVRRTPSQLGHKPQLVIKEKYDELPIPRRGRKIPGGARFPSKNSSMSERSSNVRIRSKKKVSSYSDSELRAMVNRLQMEEQYEDLIKRRNDRNNSSPKNQFVHKVMTQAINAVVNKAVNEVANSVVSYGKEKVTRGTQYLKNKYN